MCPIKWLLFMKVIGRNYTTIFVIELTQKEQTEAIFPKVKRKKALPPKP
jgi:hypothetical protein